MKLRIEISDSASDEVIISCRSMTEEVRRLQDAFSGIIDNNAEMILFRDDAEYYVGVSGILYFETFDNKVYAYTAEAVYNTEYKLYELEQLLPGYFKRVSKSCILNCMKVNSLSRDITGAGKAGFTGSEKSVYISRMYYGNLKEFIRSLRIK